MIPFTQIRISALGMLFWKEINELVRNKKIIFATVVFPILIYPFVFYGINKLEDLQKSKVKKEGIILACNDYTELINDLFSSSEYPFQVIKTNTPDLALLDKTAQIALSINENESSGKFEFWVFFNGSDDKSLLAYKQFMETINKKRIDWLIHHLNDSEDSMMYTNRVAFEFKDVSTSESRSGHLIAKILPFILILMLISGCSYTAVDLIAGEKERGTLETLLVSPLTRKEIIAGKFLVVFTSGIVSVVLNFLGIYASLKTGLISSTESFEFQLNPFALMIIFSFTVPLAILFSACLMLFTAKAKTFQEGQIYLLPFTLIAMVPAIAAVLPGMTSDSILVLFPVANIVIGIREILEGVVKIPWLILGNIMNLIYAGAALVYAVRYLEKEGSLVSHQIQVSDFQAIRTNYTKSGMISYAITWLIMFYVMGPFQAKYPNLGLIVTLYGLMLGAAYFHMRYNKLPIVATMQFRLPHPSAWLAIVPFVSGVMLCMVSLLKLQQKFMPMPENFMKSFEQLFYQPDLSMIYSVFLFAISPGICEEILFRGALQGSFMRSMKPAGSILLAALLFAFLHFSIYRLLGTFIIGCALGYLAYRYKSIYPAMVTHALYNGALMNLVEKIEAGLKNWLPVVGIACLAAGLLLTRLPIRQNTGQTGKESR